MLVTGNITTLYAVEENGDPNVDVDSNDPSNTELHYFIKWKDWAHIHNTWESETTLKEQKVKGMKKLENFIKKELELQIWRNHASPEDIEYYECQMELQQELLKSYTNVERIIGNKTALWVVFLTQHLNSLQQNIINRTELTTTSNGKACRTQRQPGKIPV